MPEEELSCDHCGEEILDGGYKYKGVFLCTECLSKELNL